MYHTNKGISITGFFTFSLFLCIGLIFVFRFIPLYIEHFNVKQTLNSVAKHKFSGENVPALIRKTMSKQLDLESVTSVTSRDASIIRDKHGYRVIMEYDTKVPLTNHISVVLHFHDEVVVSQNVG